MSDSATLWPVARQAPLSREFSRPEYWSDVPNTGVESIPFSRGSFQPRDRSQVSRIAGGFFTVWATWEAIWLEQVLTRALRILPPHPEDTRASPVRGTTFPLCVHSVGHHTQSSASQTILLSNYRIEMFSWTLKRCPGGPHPGLCSPGVSLGLCSQAPPIPAFIDPDTGKGASLLSKFQNDPSVKRARLLC